MSGVCVKLIEDSLLDAPGNLGLWVVADGMGGHDAGDFASQTVWLLSWIKLNPSESSARGLLSAMEARVIAANTKCCDETAREKPRCEFSHRLHARNTDHLRGRVSPASGPGDSRVYRMYVRARSSRSPGIIPKRRS